MNYPRQQLVGAWYRSEVDDAGCVQTEFAKLLEDGSYEFSFSIHNAALALYGIFK